MKNFKKLEVWKKSMSLAKEIYFLAKFLPKEERYGLYSQITRSAVSIPSNIAEGSAKSTEKEYKRYLEIALGSAFELETQLLLIQSLQIINKDIEQTIDQTCEVQKMLQGLIRKLI
ncbi:four helix bundle protein [Marinifilum sp. D737]|uniref:four helix bundle protein n=1 Tax=Marinifilum sp. D737 TaxID=2969628 RepID=UPI0022759D41|nr:four helix bundle protein [Marinifilum sp. D737]MCY1636425.1 four helix bundle protein [Marinifilum sp. D737]